MADKFLTPNASRPGTYIEKAPATVGGVGSADRIPALNASGELAESMFPATISGTGTLVAVASENLVIGPVDVFNNAGTLSVRRADAASGSVKPADGFVKATYSSGATDVVVYRQGNLSGLSGLTVGADVFLGKTPGTFAQDVSAYAAGDFVQRLGLATSTSAVLFELSPGYQLA